MKRFITMTILALSLSISLAGNSSAEETKTKAEFKGIFKGSYRESYPQASVTKRYLITNASYSNKKRKVGDEDTVLKMSEKMLNDFILKSAERCQSRYFVIEEVATSLGYHPNGSLLVVLDANVVCFNTDK